MNSMSWVQRLPIIQETANPECENCFRLRTHGTHYTLLASQVLAQSRIRTVPLQVINISAALLTSHFHLARGS